MEDVTHLASYKSLPEAQNYLRERVKQFQQDHTNVLQTNLDKVSNMILKAKNVNTLMMDVANFILAHPSEGLKVIK